MIAGGGEEVDSVDGVDRWIGPIGRMDEMRGVEGWGGSIREWRR